MIEALFRYLPRGGSLPCAVWAKRHRAMTVILWLHLPLVMAVGLGTENEPGHVVLESMTLVGFAVLAMLDRIHRNLRMLATSLGLLTASALLVHFSEGTIEMHFHFFVVVAAVTLYQAWLPFLTAIAYVVGQHGIMGAISASNVYNHPAARANPWKWALVHGLFILGESVALLVAWRLNEDSRAAAEASYEKRLLEEEARREAQEAYGRIFENSLEGIYETRAGTGEILTANPALARILGYDSPEEMIGRSVLQDHYADPEDRKRFLDLLIRDGEVKAFEFEVRRTDGSSIWLSNNAHAVTDAAGELVSIQGMVEDITARREAHQKRQELEAQLRQAQKMEAVGQLAGGVAHDFNNLLSIIQNYARFSLEGLKPDDPRALDLEEVLRAGRRGSDLVRRLMAFSRREILVGTTLDLNEIVGELGKMLRRTLGEDISLKTDLGSDLWTIEADAGHVEQILMNLVLNARDAMPAGGEVRVDTFNYTSDGRETDSLPAIAPGDYVGLRVSDNGLGMPPEVRDRIFEPFFTTKDVGAGTGLGLATVYGIVEHWKGFISVASVEGKGTTFTIWMPVSKDLGPKEKIAAASAAEEDGNGTILVVEDEGSVLELVRRILSANGYKVITAGSAAEARDVLATVGANIDLFLSDMVMPETSGKELADEIEERFPDAPVIFMSGYSDDVLAKHGAIAPERVLAKPFIAEDLLRHVHRALGPATAITA